MHQRNASCGLQAVLITMIWPVLGAVLLTATMAAQTRQSAAEGGLAAARAPIARLIAASGAETVGMAVYDLAMKQTLLINERTTFHAASTMKLPVMMEVFRRVQAGTLSLQQTLLVKNEFASLVDGSPFKLDPADDSDATVYAKIGQTMTVLELTRRMIVASSNLATNLLIQELKAPVITATAHALGATSLQVKRGVEDGKAFRAGLNNTTTAADLLALLRALGENKFLSARARQQMIEILAAQEHNNGIPAGLPPQTKVAHKTGVITKHHHDAALVFPGGKRKPYVLVILTRGLAAESRSAQLMADIAQQVHAALSPR